MNVKRFVGKNAREAMALARAAYGDQAVVLSNRPIPGGVEILAMPSAEVPVHGERAAQPQHAGKPAAAAPDAAEDEPMSTVSFQDFVRERQRLEAQRTAEPKPAVAAPRAPVEPGRFAAQALAGTPAARPAAPAVRSTKAVAAIAEVAGADDMMSEIKAMRGMISSQLAAMSWFDNARRSPVQTQLLRLMISNGFSPVLARQLIKHLPHDAGEAKAGQWLVDALARNLHCVAEDDTIARKGGVYAVVGATGVGKTTTTAKIAANFAMRHGAASVGLITVDTYRMAASDQLRAFGRLLNIPVHTARDAASLSDLLNLFSAKKLVLIDTIGLGQRDARLPELFSALPAGRVTRLLALNAAAQPETLDEVAQAYGVGPGTRVAITKLDEAARAGGIADVIVRRQFLVEGIANGQRVPEDWHAARAPLLAQKALLKQRESIFTHDDGELGLLLTDPSAQARAAQAGGHHV
jgi:flagellar biosynthesis protein FlhF